MRFLALTVVSLSSLLFLSSSSFAEEVVYPPLTYEDNHSKTFLDEDEFYITLDKEIYQEFENAAFSLRQKIAFKDVPSIDNTFNVKTNHHQEKMNLQHNTDIHPNRQVYYMASFYQNDKEEFHKFAVIDAETKVVLIGGNSYHHYVNPYK